MRRLVYRLDMGHIAMPVDYINYIAGYLGSVCWMAEAIEMMFDFESNVLEFNAVFPTVLPIKGF